MILLINRVLYIGAHNNILVVKLDVFFYYYFASFYAIVFVNEFLMKLYYMYL